MRKPLVLLLALLTLPASLLAQSLGEVAAQEKARREREKAKETAKKAHPTKAFTDDDLQPGAKRDKTEPPPPLVEPYVSPAPAQPEGAEAEVESGPKAEWRQRAAAARQGVETARQAVSSIANDAERLRQDLNPMSLTYQEDVNTILRLQHELNEMEKKLAEANLQVEAAEKSYKSFEEEARRNGVPQSWLE